jgi:hypothetical protein
MPCVGPGLLSGLGCGRNRVSHAWSDACATASARAGCHGRRNCCCRRRRFARTTAALSEGGSRRLCGIFSHPGGDEKFASKVKAKLVRLRKGTHWCCQEEAKIETRLSMRMGSVGSGGASAVVKSIRGRCANGLMGRSFEAGARAKVHGKERPVVVNTVARTTSG